MVISIGKFDGIHNGHQLLLDELESIGSAKNYQSLVLRFQNNPQSILKGGLPNSIMYQNALERRLSVRNIDHLVEMDFTDAIAKIGPSEFINLLCELINIKHIVVGSDFKYGYMAKGNIQTIKKEGIAHNFDVTVMPPLMFDSSAISSTRIRNLLKAGELPRAYEMMSVAYQVSGLVVSGRRLGRKIGFPTANLAYDEEFQLLPNGVYISMTRINDILMPSITNLGHNPTVNDGTKKTIETHILGMDNDIYGEDIIVYFLEKLRDEIKFNNIEILHGQINKDLMTAIAMHIDKKDIYNSLCL